MSTARKNKQGERVVCFCYCVSEAEIIQAIRSGATTLMEVRRVTNANTGCGGCGEDVKKLLRKHAPKATDDSAEDDANDG